MNAKNAKATFSFHVFLSSLAGEPLAIKYKEMANILNVSESTLSKLRHSRLGKMPAGLHPTLMASRFAAGILQKFAPAAPSTTKCFAAYAQMLNDKYIISDSLARFAALFPAHGSIDEDRAKKLYSGMIPELIERCYEEAYSNAEQDYANWALNHSKAKSGMLYQKMCDAVNQDALDGEKLKQLLNVVYAASLRNHYSEYYSGFSFLETINSFIRSQVNQPFYPSVRRSEMISISEDSKKMVRTVRAQEQIVAQSLKPMEFTLTQSFYHAVQTPVRELIELAFQKFSCTVDNLPLIRYINIHENTGYVSPLQFVTAVQAADTGSGKAFTELVLRFTLYPIEAGEPIHVAYEYSCTSPFFCNISCNYSYILQYPCKFLDHEFVLDAQTRRRWGMRVELFAPIISNAYGGKSADEVRAKSSGTTDAMRVTFYDWTIPGTGYYRNLYELKYLRSASEPSRH